jgi:hypothetical protein
MFNIQDSRMTSEKIRTYCEEALTISQLHGVDSGLAFLIGEKFSLVFYQLKVERDKLKFLYPDSISGNKSNFFLRENRALQLSYTLTINENYRGIFEQVDFLEEVLDQFINEVKEFFSLEDIHDYLKSFPRLAFKESSSSKDGDFLDKNAVMSVQDIISEVEDILFVNEMHHLFI